jgi:hypothetical protein
MKKKEYNTSKKKQIKEEIDKLKEKYPNYNFIAWHKDTDIDYNMN